MTTFEIFGGVKVYKTFWKCLYTHHSSSTSHLLLQSIKLCVFLLGFSEYNPL